MFMIWIDEQLKKMGAKRVVRHVRAGSVDYSRTLERLGYDKAFTAYEKEL
jgi:hypothetical protein